MADLTTIDRNQEEQVEIVEEEEQQEQELPVGQLLSQEQQQTTDASVSTITSSVNDYMPTTTTTGTSNAKLEKGPEYVKKIKGYGEHRHILPLEEQLLIELDSDIKQTAIEGVVEDEVKRKRMRKESSCKTAAMELSQIELIYRAEGNANLVLALPQFKKVLRLPKSPNISNNTPITSTTKIIISQQYLDQQQNQEQDQLQSTPHVVANIKDVEMDNNDSKIVLDQEEAGEGEYEKVECITMQYQNTSASTDVHQNAKG